MMDTARIATLSIIAVTVLPIAMSIIPEGVWLPAFFAAVFLTLSRQRGRFIDDDDGDEFAELERYANTGSNH